MARLNTYTCSICETIKKITNHWWLGVPSRTDYNPKSPSYALIFGYSLIRWDDEAAKKEDVDHLCGIECALKWMGTKLDQLTK